MKLRHTAEEIRQGRLVLCNLFPETFVAPKLEKKPLGLGIRDEIWRHVKDQIPGFKKSLLQSVLHEYTSGVRYLGNMKAGAPRIWIDGATVGVVTPEEAAFAELRLKKRLAWISGKHNKKENLK